jgi:hypothetical protein
MNPRRFESIFIAVLAGIALLVSILDSFRALDGLPWLSKRIPEITLLMVGAILTHLVLTDWYSGRELRDAVGESTAAVRESTDKIHDVVRESTDKIQDAVRGLVFHEIGSAAEYFRYATLKISSARESVDDVTWGQSWNPHISTDTKIAYDEYRATVEKTCCQRGKTNVVYREIMSFPDGQRIGRVKELLTSEYPNYHLKYFDYSHGGTPPLLQFFVIDKREALVSVLSSTAFQNRYFAIEGSAFAKALKGYFELAWGQGEILKDPSGIQTEVLNNLKSRYSIP